MSPGRRMNDHPTTDDATPTLGLRCAWCGRVQREPVGYPNPDDHLAWTHGICRDCQQLCEGAALLSAHADRDAKEGPNYPESPDEVSHREPVRPLR
jgi:hypothetical protein